MCRCHSRRTVIAMIAAAPIAGCRGQTKGPEKIRFGRETCETCGMIISDPQFAAEVRGGPDRKLVKFDDIGDAVLWLQKQFWAKDDAVEFWVMDSIRAEDWLDARKVFYNAGAHSPMGFGFAAVEAHEAESVTFAEMQEAVLAKGGGNMSMGHGAENG